MTTKEQFVEALDKGKLSENQWRTLRVIYSQPGHKCSPAMLVELLGYKDLISANGAFGVAARTIGEYLGNVPDEGNGWAIANWNSDSKEWVLLDSFAEALETVGIEQEATSYTASAQLAAIKPTQRLLLMDLVRKAGVDVSDWANVKGGPKNAGRNPKYCYEWSFVHPDKVVVLNLWHNNIVVGTAGALISNIDIRRFASQRPSPEKERALRVDNAIQEAIKENLPIRVIVLDGKRRSKNSTEPSVVTKRLLDPIPWGVVEYNWDNGDCVLIRDSVHSPNLEGRAQAIQVESINWTREELKESVEAYLDLKRKMQSGEEVNKKQYYRDLSKRFGRSEKAYEYRMQNISYVLSLTGREWIAGLLPAANVGANVAAQIEELLAEVENRPTEPAVKFEAIVQTKLKKTNVLKPTGVEMPKAAVSQTIQYDRDPDVKAWVLKKSEGKCECCNMPAPFLSPAGTPFLEVHHVRQLAEGGPDTVENAVALCPNCHREIHHGANGKKLVEGLYASITRLERHGVVS